MRRDERLRVLSEQVDEVQHVHAAREVYQRHRAQYKRQLKFEAKRLRKLGLSIRDIAGLLGCAFQVINRMKEIK